MVVATSSAQASYDEIEIEMCDGRANLQYNAVIEVVRISLNA